MRRLFVAAALAVAIAACGGGSDDSAETRFAAEAPVTTVAPAASTPAEPAVADDDQGPADIAVPATTAAPTTAAPAPIEVPEKLQHVGDAVGGGELDLSVYAGRDTIAWFWAPW